MKLGLRQERIRSFLRPSFVRDYFAASFSGLEKKQYVTQLKTEHNQIVRLCSV